MSNCYSGLYLGGLMVIGLYVCLNLKILKALHRGRLVVIIFTLLLECLAFGSNIIAVMLNRRKWVEIAITCTLQLLSYTNVSL